MGKLLSFRGTFCLEMLVLSYEPAIDLNLSLTLFYESGSRNPKLPDTRLSMAQTRNSGETTDTLCTEQ